MAYSLDFDSNLEGIEKWGIDSMLALGSRHADAAKEMDMDVCTALESPNVTLAAYL